MYQSTKQVTHNKSVLYTDSCNIYCGLICRSVRGILGLEHLNLLWIYSLWILRHCRLPQIRTLFYR